MGYPWRMPQEYELDELKNKCNWELTYVNSQYCYKVTGPNGNHIIILPNIKNTGICYWTATQSADRDRFAEGFDFSIRTEGVQSEEEKEHGGEDFPVVLRRGGAHRGGRLHRHDESLRPVPLRRGRRRRLHQLPDEQRGVRGFSRRFDYGGDRPSPRV